jgi:hypothetical protein
LGRTPTKTDSKPMTTWLESKYVTELVTRFMTDL